MTESRDVEDAHSSDLSNVQISSGFVMTSRLLQEGRPLIERVLVGNPQRNTTHAYSETGDQYRPRLDEYAQEQRSPMPRNEMHSLFSNIVPVNSGRSASTTLPSLARSSCDEDVFTEAKPQPIDQEKFGYRGDLDGGLRAQAGSWGDIIRSLPTLSSDSSGSSISTLATPASPSPAPRHVRRAQSRLSLPAPTPTPAAVEPSRRVHARMSLMCPLPTPAMLPRRNHAPHLTANRLTFLNSPVAGFGTSRVKIRRIPSMCTRYRAGDCDDDTVFDSLSII